MSKMVTAEVDIKGNIHVPEEFGIKPRDKIIIRRMDDTIIIKKPKKEIAQGIQQMTRENFEDIAWEEIEKEREDREW